MNPTVLGLNVPTRVKCVLSPTLPGKIENTIQKLIQSLSLPATYCLHPKTIDLGENVQCVIGEISVHVRVGVTILSCVKHPTLTKTNVNRRFASDHTNFTNYNKLLCIAYMQVHAKANNI